MRLTPIAAHLKGNSLPRQGVYETIESFRKANSFEKILKSGVC